MNTITNIQNITSFCIMYGGCPLGWSGLRSQLSGIVAVELEVGRKRTAHPCSLVGSLYSEVPYRECGGRSGLEVHEGWPVGCSRELHC